MVVAHEQEGILMKVREVIAVSAIGASVVLGSAGLAWSQPPPGGDGGGSGPCDPGPCSTQTLSPKEASKSAKSTSKAATKDARESVKSSRKAPPSTPAPSTAPPGCTSAGGGTNCGSGPGT